MPNLVCKACNLSKTAPACPRCSKPDEPPVSLLEAEGKAMCSTCGHTQALPKHCGWDMTIVSI